MPKNYTCAYPGCMKVFARSTHLLAHRVRHYPNERLHCKWVGCKLTFTRNDTRDFHFRRHLQETQRVESLPAIGELVAEDVQEVPGPGSEPNALVQIARSQAKLYTQSTATTNTSPLVIQTASSASLQIVSRPTHILQWLIYGLPNSTESLLEESNLLSKIFNSRAPIFAQCLKVDHSIRAKLLKCIPLLDLDFSVQHISMYLEVYWSLFDPQFPFLHKPSFNYTTANPILLLSMIMFGAKFSGCSQVSTSIAEPLRWLIYLEQDSKSDFCPLYILQSLVLLEAYEVNCSSRKLHNRASSHRNLLHQITGQSVNFQVNDPWLQWIDFESRKRTKLVAGHLAIVTSIHFGGTPGSLFTQLSFPCDDLLWEHNNPANRFIPTYLIDVLSNILKRVPVHTNSLGNNLLLLSLLSILFQTKLSELRMFGCDGSSWSDSLYQAIEAWKDCLSSDAPHTECVSFGRKGPAPSSVQVNSQHKFNMYHIGQIHVKLNVADIVAYCRYATNFEGLELNIILWTKSPESKVSVVHAYLLLSGVLISHDKDKTYVYDPQSDPFIYRKNSVAIAIFVIYAYVYSKHGPEAVLQEDVRCSAVYPSKEDGGYYLKRVHQNLFLGSNSPIVLSRIPNLHHIVGLLNILHKSYKSSDCEIDIGFANIMKNCILRCLGRTG